MAQQIAMIDRLKQLNPDFPLYSVYDPAFSEYGRVIEADVSKLVAQTNMLTRHKDGVEYQASVAALEQCDISDYIRRELFGQLDAQIGCCMGNNSKLNAVEWHTCSEINVAATPLVLLLGRRCDITSNHYDSSKIVGFYLAAGCMVEVYATSLHYCPCQVQDSGFRCVVALPRGTNTPLEPGSHDKLLAAKNKWLLRCGDGITGENYTVNY